MRGAETADTGSTWDAALAGWDESPAAALLRRYSDAVNGRLLVDWLEPGGDGRVLKTDLFDEAVGAGLVPTLRERAGRVVGIDVSPAVVAAARLRYPELEARCADTRRLPFADASFDAVVSNSTLDHFAGLDEVADALAELRRVLKPDGQLLITLDNGANPLVLLRNVLPTTLLRALRLVPYPIGATCGPRRLVRLLADAGFELDARRALMHCPRVLARAAWALAPSRSAAILRGAMALERLGAAPTRYLTGQFVAASARKPAASISPGSRAASGPRRPR